MLNKPKFMKPSTNKEECTIDLTAKKIPFSCIVDGNESIKAWQIAVYDINDDEKVYDSGLLDLESSFYPVDEKNRNVVFTKNIKEYPNTVTDANPFTNRADAYYWTITFVGSSGNSVTSYQEVFYANKTPDIKFSYNGKHVDLNDKTPPVLNSKDCTFKAELDFGNNQDEYKSQLKRYGWRITDSANDQILVDTITKNQIYGSADNIICAYDGFLSGGNYLIELYVETQNNTKITSSFNISVSYVSTFLSNDFKVETLKNEPAVILDWDKARIIAGLLKDDKDNIVTIDNTEFKTNYPVDNHCSVEIPVGFKVEYNNGASLNFDINENSYMAFSTQLLSNNDAILFIAEGFDEDGYKTKRKLSYSNNEFKYEIEEKGILFAPIICEVKNKPSEYVWYNIFMSPLIPTESGEYTAELKVYEGKVVGCIYPSEDLYPLAETAWHEAGSSDFYPIFGNWDNLMEE